jgi:hypothetical protein
MPQPGQCAGGPVRFVLPGEQELGPGVEPARGVQVAAVAVCGGLAQRGQRITEGAEGLRDHVRLAEQAVGTIHVAVSSAM